MEWYAASHLVGVTMLAFLPFILIPFVLACAVVALAVLMYRIGIKKNSAPLPPERGSSVD